MTMLISTNKIIVKDRIRKDFGDITELALDIEDNGLINPIVINKDYVLLAGERRLRAIQRLGWEQVEVRMMDTRDAEHELNIEISENDVRKAFSKSERVDYMCRLMRIEQEKAKERMSEGGEGGVKSSTLETGRAKDKTAEAFGIGRQTMEREMSIVDNKHLLDPSDFADWDEGKLSTNKAYQKIKAELNRVKMENDSLHAANKALAHQANKPQVIEVEVEKRTWPPEQDEDTEPEMLTPARDDMAYLTIATHDYISKFDKYFDRKNQRWTFENNSDVPKETKQKLYDTLVELDDFVRQLSGNLSQLFF